jgi:pimeloyl-ACP methyl ester carboxylesterase
MGLVLVDPTQEDFMDWLAEHFPELNRDSSSLRAQQGEWASRWDSLQQARTARLPKVPLTLITGYKGHDVLSRNLLPRWLAAHQEWLRELPAARHIVTTNSGHGIPFTEPELVISAIRTMSRAPDHHPLEDPAPSHSQPSQRPP